MNILKYPIGVQSFEDLRTRGYLYADKTGYIYDLVSRDTKHVFLSRPRRFGKSLLMSTFKYYFEGRKDLFEGLKLGQLETKWESFPVLHFSFGSLVAENQSDILEAIHKILEKYEVQYKVQLNKDVNSIGTRFGFLIENIAKKTEKRVVILIDEYDKGIVDILQDQDKLKSNIKLFKSFYTQLKDQDDYIHFVLLTGVSRFRDLTLFSSANQFQDISLNPRYAAICGLTKEELDTVFAESIEELAIENNYSIEEAKELLKSKYDGYRFTKKDILVYNPFSILNCFYDCNLGDYWIKSGGASKVFIDFLKESSYTLEEIENKWVNEDTLSGPYSLTDPVPLLFQTGYLTIKDYDDQMYLLGLPNGEVRSALIKQLAPDYLGITSDYSTELTNKLYNFAKRGNVVALLKEFQSIIAQIPHQQFRLNNVENIYNLSIWLICKLTGIKSRSEVSVAGGDIDMVIETHNYVYVMEFKKDHGPKEALKQINSNGYSLPWVADGRKVFKIGIEYSSEKRNILKWDIEE